MPLYEYRCNDCRATFEVLRPMAQRELAAVCPQCESRASMPLLSVVAKPGGEWTGQGVQSMSAKGGGGCCGGSCGCG